MGIETVFKKEKRGTELPLLPVLTGSFLSCAKMPVKGLRLGRLFLGGHIQCQSLRRLFHCYFREKLKHLNFEI